MTIVTTADSKKKPRVKPPVERAQDKADALARKQKLKAGIAVAIEAIDRIVEELADEHEITFERACTLVHLGGRVFKDRRRPSIQNAYRFCLARIEDGRWNADDDPERAEAVRIIRESRQRGDDYKSISKADQGALLALLQENRDARETGIVGKPQMQLQDIRMTVEKVNAELANLCARSKFEYILVGARSNPHSPTTASPIMCVSEAGGEFITRFLKLEPAALAKHFNAYAMNRSGIPGIVRALASDMSKGDKKTSIKAVIMPMLHRQYRDLTKREYPRLDWTKWARGEADSNGIVLHGWPLQCPPMALSNIRTMDEMKTILEAVVQGDCYFKVAASSCGGHKHGDHPGAQNSMTGSPYKRGGFIVRFDEVPENTRKTASEREGGRKRKSPDAHLGADGSNDEDTSPDITSAPRPPKRLAPIPIETESTAAAFPSSLQLPS